MAGREFRHANQFDPVAYRKYVTRDSVEIQVDKDNTDKIIRAVKDSPECKFIKNIENDEQYTCGIKVEYNNNIFTVVLIRAPIPHERYDLTVDTMIKDPLIKKLVLTKFVDFINAQIFFLKTRERFT